MRPRFELDSETGKATTPPPVLIDPEAFDASEQQFAASLEPATGKFVVEREENLPTKEKFADPAQTSTTQTEKAFVTEPQEDPEVVPEGIGTTAFAECPVDAPEAFGTTPSDAPNPAVLAEADPDSWRQEVAARLSHYRSKRRPRAPRYPSLRLKFDDFEPARSAPANDLPPATRQSLAVERIHADPAPVMPQEPGYAEPVLEKDFEDETIVESSAVEPDIIPSNIIEFPRSAAMPAPVPLDELAEPAFVLPRILEAAEVAPPGPALGGILIEPPPEPPVEKRPGFEIPLQSAPMAQRLGATAFDATIVIAAFALFAFLFFKITGSVPPLLPAAGSSVLVLGILWTLYQYLMLVGAGTTPGLWLAKLQLNRFDGSPVPRSLRRWRVLASVISAVSLALGYAWCFFDEDQLCWHDRITRTYMAPRG